MFHKTIVSKKNPNIKIILDIEDDAPDGETLQIIKRLQESVDQFDDVEEFEAVMESISINWQEEYIH